MINHLNIADHELRKKLRTKELTFAGNKVLKIYGRLQCHSGKRMKRKNRIFFESEQEAVSAGYRPCGHCMKEKYIRWKKEHGLI